MKHLKWIIYRVKVFYYLRDIADLDILHAWSYSSCFKDNFNNGCNEPKNDVYEDMNCYSE